MSRKLQRQLLVRQPYSLNARFEGALRLSQTFSQSFPAPIADPLPCAQWLQQPDRQAPPMLTGQVSPDAIGLLPLWLFTHESWRQRLNWLTQIPTWVTLPSSHQASLWLYGEAIAQVLQPQVIRPQAVAQTQLERLLPSLTDRWQRQTHQGAPPLGPIWENLLPQLQQWQQQHTPLNQIARIAHDRDESPIAVSLFSLVTSGPDWSIAQTRAQRLLPDDTTLPSLLGGLWGAAYGWTGLALEACTIENYAIETQPNPNPSWKTLSQALLQTWSGQLPQPERATPIVLAPR